MGATVDRIEIYGYGRWGVDTIGCSYGACDSILGGVSGIPLVLGPMVGPDLNLPIFDNRRGGGRKGGDGKGERKYGDKTPNQEKEDKRSTPHPKPGFKWVPNPQTGKPDMKPWPEDIRKGGDGSGVHPNSLGDIKPPTSNNSDSTDWLGAAGSIALGGIIGGAAAACVAAEPCGAFLAGGIAIFSFSF